MGRYTDIARSVKTQVSFIPSSVDHEQAEETCFIGEKKIRLYMKRKSCVAAGHCLSLTRERDCELYPARPGLCRERV